MSECHDVASKCPFPINVVIGESLKPKVTSGGGGGDRSDTPDCPCMQEFYPPSVLLNHTGSSDEALHPRRAIQAAMEKFVDFGLGRGVDATKSRPFVEKASFQVFDPRHVPCLDQLIGTAEGNSLEEFDDVIASSQSLRLELKSSVTADKTVSINVGGEAERVKSISQRVFGKRILRRTIAFQVGSSAQCSDVEEPEHDCSCEPKCTLKCSKCNKWNCICHGKKLKFEEILKDWTDKKMKDNDRIKLDTACKEFVKTFGITHFVSSITLGAMKYLTRSEEVYQTMIKSSGGLGVSNVLDLQANTSKKWKKSKIKHFIQCLGKFSEKEDSVEEEAVLSVKLAPLDVLVADPALKVALQGEIIKYIANGTDDDPSFHIIAENNQGRSVYLRVDEGREYRLVGTEHKDDTQQEDGRKLKDGASIFSLAKVDEGRAGNNDFSIIYKPADQAYFEESGPEHELKEHLQLYLKTKLTFFGNQHELIRFQAHCKKSNARYALHSPLHKSFSIPRECPFAWLKEKEGLLINCQGRRGAWDGYLALRRSGSHTYEATIVPRRSRAYDSDYMVFRALVVNNSEERNQKKSEVERRNQK